MGNFIRRNTVGRFRDGVDSMRQKVGERANTLDYVVASTTQDLSRSLDYTFGKRAMKQLGKEISPDHDYRIYTESMRPATQVRKGRICMTPKVLEYEINKGYDSKNDRIGISLESDGRIKYTIETDNGPQTIPLKGMDSETRKRVGERVSAAIDNRARDFAGRAMLMNIIGAKSFSFSYSLKDGTKKSLSFPVNILYDMMFQKHHDTRNYFYKNRAVIDVVLPSIQEKLLAGLQKHGKISNSSDRQSIVDQVSGASISSLTKKQINFYEGLRTRDYGVSRKVSSMTLEDFDDMASAAGHDVDTLKKSQQEADEELQKENQTLNEEQNENESQNESSNTANEGSEKSDEVAIQLTDYINNPSKYSYADIMQQFSLWKLAGKLSSSDFQDYKIAIDAMRDEGKLKKIAAVNTQGKSKVIPLNPMQQAA